MKKYVHTVQYYETDKMAITHHSNYIRWMEEARVYLLKESGYGFERMEAEGVGSPVVSVEAQYKKTTAFADEIFISARVTEMKPIRMAVEYTMENAAGEIVFTGKSTHCFINSEGKLMNLKKENEPAYNAFLGLMDIEFE